MIKRPWSEQKNIFNFLRLNIIYLILVLKIFLFRRYLSIKAINFKSIFSILLTFSFLFVIPNILWSQESNNPWVPEGGNFEITKSLTDHYLPTIATNGTLFLLVWYAKTPYGFDIYGRRIDSSGNLIDEEELHICTEAGDQIFPSIASDGENFFVVWQDNRSGKRWEIYGARVTAEGQVLEPNGILIATGKSSNDQVSPTLCFDGENYLVAWQGKRTAKIWNVYFKRISKDGEILDNKPIPIDPSLKNQVSPSVAFNGENFFVVWQDKRNNKFWEIYGARVARSGEVLDGEGIQITFTDGVDRWKPIISWNGIYYFIIWSVSNGENNWYIYGKRVGYKGEVFDLIDISILGEGSNKGFPAMLWDGTEYLLIWEEEPEGKSEIYATSILPQYRIAVGDWMLISSQENQNASFPAIERIENKVLVVWQAQSSEGNWKIFGQLLKNSLY